MRGQTQASLGIGLPTLPENQRRLHLVVGSHSPLLHKNRSQGSRRQGILQGIGPFPAAAHNPYPLRFLLQQALSHGASIRQGCRDHTGDVTHLVERTGAVGGAHEQTLPLHHLRGHSHR